MKGHGRKLKPESEVDQIIDVRPESCEQCGALLLGDDRSPGAASSDGVTADHTDGDGIPASSPLLCGVWGEHASAVAGDDADAGVLDRGCKRRWGI